MAVGHLVFTHREAYLIAVGDSPERRALGRVGTALLTYELMGDFDITKTLRGSTPRTAK